MKSLLLRVSQPLRMRMTVDQLLRLPYSPASAFGLLSTNERLAVRNRLPDVEIALSFNTLSSPHFLGSVN